MAPNGTEAQASKDSQVEFTDVKGRKLLFKLNTSGALDYYVDGRQKVSQIKDLRAAGTTLLFDGKRLMTSEKEAEIPKSDSEVVISSIMSLCNKAVPSDTATPANIQRCFVQVLRGEGLRAADVTGFSDPYCICGVPGKPATQDQTRRKKRTLKPVWDEFLEIHGYQVGEALDFTVMDHDYFTKDDFLGWARVSGEELSSRFFEGALDLKDDGQHGTVGRGAKGKIHVKIFVTGGDEEVPTTWSAEAPATNGEEVAPETSDAKASSRNRSDTIVSQELAKAASTAQVNVEFTDSDDKEELPSASPNSREDLISAVFRSLDAQGTGRIGSAEVLRYAETLGFHPDDREWAVEYEEVCKSVGCEAEAGLDRTQFINLVEHDMVGYCDDETLQDSLKELQKQDEAKKENVKRSPVFVSMCWRPRKKTQDMLDQKPREVLVSELFSSLDVDKDKRLKLVELRRYAEYCGFSGTDDEWFLEYAELSVEYGWEPKDGADLAQFSKLVENRPNGGYSDDNELRECMASVGATTSEHTNPARSRENVWTLRPKTIEHRSKRDRPSLVKALFQTLDANNEGRLGPEELRRYAEMCGFEGTEDEWATHYAEVCNDYGINARGGANPEQFAKIMDNKAGQADVDSEDLVKMIEEAKAQTMVPKDRRRYLIRKRSTWRPLSVNFEILRSFSLFLRNRFSSPEAAFQAFTLKPFGRLKKDEFLAGIKKVEFDGDAESVFRLLALGSMYIVKKHFKWAWNLLAPEELVLARKKTREETARSRGQSRVSFASAVSATSAFSPSNSPVIVTGEDVQAVLFPTAD